MKVEQADSIMLGTRKLWGIFPIKQKFDTVAAFLDTVKSRAVDGSTIQFPNFLAKGHST